jgi:serine/threonine protein kinase
VAEDEEGTRWIMKVLHPRHPAEAKRFEQEAFVLQVLDHPGLPHTDIDDYFKIGLPQLPVTLNCLVQEFIPGQSLEDWLQGKRRATQAQILDWLKQLVELLKVIHERGFVHCDVKPDNILLQPNGKLALVDFGFVCALGKGTEGVTMGTPEYIAPEQIEGWPTPQSDFYSLGWSMIHLATSKSPASLKEPTSGQPSWRSPAPQIEPPVADLLERLIAPSLGERPPTAQAILESLQQLPEQLRQHQRRQRLASWPVRVAVGTVAALLLAGAGKGGFNLVSEVSLRWGLQDQLYGDLESSRTNLERAVWWNSGSADARSALGLTCQLLQDIDCAFRQYQKALQLNPRSWETRNNLASLYEEQGDFTRAEKQYQAALQQNPQQAAVAISNLARLKNRTRDYETALSLALQGLEQTDDPAQEAALQRNLGWAQFGLGQFQKAEMHLQASINLESRKADAYCLLAQVEEALGKRQAARDSWECCIRLDSSNPEVQQWRDQILDRLLQQR